MAIDNADKRASASSYFLTNPCPAPDGDVDGADRLQVTGLYCGIAASAPVVGGGRIRRGLLLGVY